MSSFDRLIDDTSLADTLVAVEQRLASLEPRLIPLFRECFPNTLTTTVQLLEDGTTFVITGDIPAMWLRDSSAQVRPYCALAAENHTIRKMLAGLIRRQAFYILTDPYANAFNPQPNGNGHSTDRTHMSPWVWERKFELDSLCYPVRLCWDYWTATGDRTLFDDTLRQMFRRIIDTMRTEQHHDNRSEYRFERDDVLLPSDTLPFGGTGTRTNFTGMVWSGFRPSDDACKFGYHLPDNMFASIILDHIAELVELIYQDVELAQDARQLKAEIDFGIQTYGIVDHPRFGKIYAYETDGFGNYNLMDDANVPSLLSLPYLGYCAPDDPLYLRTRAFVLSDENPNYHSGRYASGVGSPHTPGNYVWHLGLIMQGLTATDSAEQRDVIDMILATTAGTNLMHEGFDPDAPERYTRPWFAWANSLFSEFVMQWVEQQGSNNESSG